jgi:hypothetical protein
MIVGLLLFVEKLLLKDFAIFLMNLLCDKENDNRNLLQFKKNIFSTS